MLEVGNGDLTVAEQRSHFALWCLLKSPLLIGSDVRALPAASLSILKTAGLVGVNQDALGVQGTLRAASAAAPAAPAASAATSGTADHAAPRAPPPSSTPPPSRGALLPPRATAAAAAAAAAAADDMMTYCSTDGSATTPGQQWRFEGFDNQEQRRLVQAGTNLCLARTAAAAAASKEHSGAAATAPLTRVGTKVCDEKDAAQMWHFGRVNETLSQVRDGANASSCLTYNGLSLHMEGCRADAANCSMTRCRFSTEVWQLWYLNSLAQLSSSYTNFPGGAPPLSSAGAGAGGGAGGSGGDGDYLDVVPRCLATQPWPAPQPPPPPPAVDDYSLPLQVWAGPLAGGDFAVLLLNTGNLTSNITARWADIGIGAGVTVTATDLWTGRAVDTATGSVTAEVATHDNAAFRLSPK
jgi:hypothetical protein